MKIFFLGGLGADWMSGWQRCQALRELGHEIVPFPQGDYMQSASHGRVDRWLTGQIWKEEEIDRFNLDFLQAVKMARPEIAWLEWPKLLRPETIQAARARLPRCSFVCFQDDNPFGGRNEEKNSWRLFIEAIPEYDLHFVKRRSDVAEFSRRRAQRVELFRHGFYAPIFQPEPSSEFHQDVSFVGTALDHRVGCIAELMGAHRIPVQVFGNKWSQRTLAYYRHRKNFHPAVTGRDYARVISRSRISLGYVSSSNGDEYTMRTFEIPACGGFFLAERTPTHQELFTEGKEAEFFGSTEECAEKIRFYLERESLRLKIAEQGYRRCLDSDYSLNRRLSEAIECIETPNSPLNNHASVHF